MVLTLVVLTFIHKEHPQLLPEVRPGQAIQEEVNTVIHVEDGPRDEHDVYVPRHFRSLVGHEERVVCRLLNEAGQEVLLAPDGGVGRVEGDEADGNGDEDDGELQPYDALLRDHLTMAVVLVPDIQGPDDYGVQNCDDNKGEEDDTEHEDAIQDEAEALVRGVRAAHVDVIRADLYRGGQTRLVQTHHQRQGDQ